MFLYWVEKDKCWEIRFPHAWESDRLHRKWFPVSKYKHPKLIAESYLHKALKYHFGEKRADHVLTVPRLTEKFRFGCCVNLYPTTTTCRGVKYTKLALAWTELNATGKSERKQRSFTYNSNNKLEVWHKAGIEAAKIRAKVTLSELHESAVNFEYDLEFIKHGI